MAVKGSIPLVEIGRIQFNIPRLLTALRTLAAFKLVYLFWVDQGHQFWPGNGVLSQIPKPAKECGTFWDLWQIHNYSSFTLIGYWADQKAQNFEFVGQYILGKRLHYIFVGPGF